MKRATQGNSNIVHRIKHKAVIWKETEMEQCWKQYFTDLYGKDRLDKQMRDEIEKERVRE